MSEKQTQGAGWAVLQLAETLRENNNRQRSEASLEPNFSYRNSFSNLVSGTTNKMGRKVEVWLCGDDGEPRPAHSTQ